MVSSEPSKFVVMLLETLAVVAEWPSLEIMNPDGTSGMLEESPPPIAISKDLVSIGA